MINCANCGVDITLFNFAEVTIVLIENETEFCSAECLEEFLDNKLLKKEIEDELPIWEELL